MTKKSMSVTEMGKLLGICKTEAYWLVKRNYFETRLVAGKMRVMVESFENWYDRQFHYRKIDGTPPGQVWGDTLSVCEIGRTLGLSDGGVYWLVNHSSMEVQIISGKKRIPRESFESWYQAQSKYKKVSNGEEDTDGINY